MDVVARVDRRFDSSTILRLSTFFHADWLRWLYCAQWRREAYRKIRPGKKKLFWSFQNNIIDFLGLKEQAQKFGLGSFDLKFYRLTKVNDKAENYTISTQQQLELELPFLLGSNGESELKGLKSVI